jgi:5-deoxy-glucuronate isomerase
MKIKQPGPFLNGINSIVKIDGPHRDYLMDFEMLKMKKGDTFSNNEALERAYLLVYGEIKVTFDGKSEVLTRENFYDFDPITVQLCKDTDITIECLNDDTEIAIFKSENEKLNRSKIRYAEDVVVETRGEGVMNDTGKRITKTILDYSIDPESNLMLGEDMHYPGKWAGFPSHHHEQPEIYFYKFTPGEKGGFGLIKLGDEGFLLQENDTLLVPPNVDHPQVAAPGYGMYFIFAIRHLENNPYITPTYVEDHLWPAEPNAVIWPNKK